MALVTSNSQGELSPLEIGLHALNCVALGEGGRGRKGGLSAYAEAIGKARQNVQTYRDGAEVAANLHIDMQVLGDKTQHLAAIHALPSECWPAAVQTMLDKGWCSDMPACVAASVRVTDGWSPSCRFCLRLDSLAGGICRSNSPARRIARAWMRSAMRRVTLAYIATVATGWLHAEIVTGLVSERFGREPLEFWCR